MLSHLLLYCILMKKRGERAQRRKDWAWKNQGINYRVPKIKPIEVGWIDKPRNTIYRARKMKYQLNIQVTGIQTR